MNNTDEIDVTYDRTLLIAIDSDSEKIIKGFTEKIIKGLTEYEGIVESVYLKNKLDNIMALDVSKFKIIIIMSRFIDDNDINLIAGFVHKVNSMNIMTTIIIEKKYANNIISRQIFIQRYCSTILLDTDHKEDVCYNQCVNFYNFNSLAINVLKLFCSQYAQGLISFDIFAVYLTLFNSGIFLFWFWNWA